MTAWPDLENVLGAMEAPTPVRSRVHQLLKLYEALGLTEFDAFVSETVDEEGIRHFESLWLFNDGATMEAALTEADDDQIDGAPIRANVIRWAARSRDYDYLAAGPDSRLSLEIWYSDDLWGGLNASGGNCDRLRDLMRKYVLPATGLNTAE